MNYDSDFSQHPIIIPFLKVIGKTTVVLWDYSERAGMYEQFIMMGDDYTEYTPVRFEKL